MTVATQTVVPLGVQFRANPREHRGRTRRSERQSREGQRTDGRILQILRKDAGEFREVTDPDKLCLLLDKHQAVDHQLFGYRPKRLHLIKQSLARLQVSNELKLDGHGCPRLARDIDARPLLRELAEQVATKGMSALKAENIQFLQARAS